jgi:hypothetical protein
MANFLKYTNLTYDEILSQIRDKISADTRFDNPRESAIFQTLIELFAGTTDITNYLLQRRAEECFFDTAQLKSSIILLARQLGYVVTRATPATAKLKIKLSGDFTDVFDSSPTADNKIQIPYYGKFTINGTDFVLINTFTYNVSSTIVSQMISETTNFSLDITKDSFDNFIDIAQGEIREKIIVGNTNRQVGSNFQKYKIEDKEFSNIYGDKDYFHNDVTRVYVGNKKDATTLYEIDRRSLVNSTSLNSNDLSTALKICLVRTTPDEMIEVIFGDGGFASKGALTREDNVYVQYLATTGSVANKTGVIGNTITYSGNIFTNTGIDITDKVTFEMNSNIVGGADIEEIDSIKFNAPKVFYSLERLVSKNDYINYLKSLKTPITVKNALAWGEQEERDKSGVFADIKMFNVSFFTVIGSLYDFTGDSYFSKTANTGLDSAVLDLDYDPDEIQTQSYFNIYTRQELANQLKSYDITSYYNKISGSQIDSSINVTLLSSNYDVNARLNFWYQSDVTDNASNIFTSGSLSADISNLNNTNADMSTIASKLNEQMVIFKDARANAFDNANYTENAFTNDGAAVVTWDSTNNRFEITFDSSSPCYITSCFGDLADDLSLSNRDLFSVSVTDKGEISGRITDVVEDLNTRSMMNIKNIYVSPIIQNFNVEGTVYVKSLYDKEEIKKDVNNSIYSWLDLNADFNVPVRVSNITNLIEDNVGILKSDIKIVPEDITAGVNNNDNKFYFGSEDPILSKYGYDIINLFGTSLLSYLNKSSYEKVNELRKFYNKFTFRVRSRVTNVVIEITNNDIHTLSEKVLDLNNYISERTFFNDFIKNIYDVLVEAARDQKSPSDMNNINNYSYVDILGNSVTNYRRFLGYNETVSYYNTFNSHFSIDPISDFVKVVGKIHKDLSYLIRLNMLDTNGNIEEEIDTNNKYVRGGYSLGSEIAKISLSNLRYEYK